MSSPVAFVIPDTGEGGPAVAPIHTSYTVDLEAQRPSPSSANGSTIAENQPPSGSRHNAPTTVSGGEQASPKPLERVPTWVVEEEAIHGYPSLASFLGGPGGYSIYRRFASLNARNLLYHQAKLVRLEHELNELEKTLESEKDLHYTVQHIFDAKRNSPGYKVAAKYDEVSRALDKYNHLLLEQQRLHQLSSPDGSFVESIHDHINSKRAPRPAWLEHPENTVYAVWKDRKPIQKDLITLHPELRPNDAFTKIFTGVILNCWHRVYRRFKRPDDDLGGYSYDEKTMRNCMRAIVMIIASALPTCSILVLYFIRQPIWRLIFIVLFSAVFAFTLTFFTEARRVDVFMASLALASVQVVFVGTAFGNGTSTGNG